MAREGVTTSIDRRRAIARQAMPPFVALRAFEAVGFLGGVRRAAEELGVDHAAVSRHLRALEAWAGVRLFDRQRRGLLTHDGALFHARVSAALDEIRMASLDLTRRGDDSRLTIWCVPGLASRWLNGRLAEFAAAHPELAIEVRPTDHGPDLSRHEADADIRYLRDTEAPPDAGIQQVTIAAVSVIAVASPEVAARLPNPLLPAALLDAPLLHEDEDHEWRRWFSAHGVEAPARLPGPRLWHAHLTLDAARRGQGGVLTTRFLLADDLDRGELVALAVAAKPADLEFGAYVLRVRKDRMRHPGIAKFRLWLERQAQREAPLGGRNW